MKTKLMTEVTSDGLYVHDEQGKIYAHEDEMKRMIEEIEEVRRPVLGEIVLAGLAGAAIYIGLYAIFFR